jgi:hypothetical protein
MAGPAFLGEVKNIQIAPIQFKAIDFSSNYELRIKQIGIGVLD